MARKIALLWSFLCIKRFLNFLKTLFQFDLTNTDGKDRRRHACPATKGLWLYYSPICRCIWLQESPSTFACCHFSVIIDDTDLRFGNLHQRVPLKEGELRTKNNLHSLPLLETLVKSRNARRVLQVNSRTGQRYRPASKPFHSNQPGL